MSLPSPNLTVPTLTADQLYFQGVTLGGTNTPFPLKKLEGLEKPDVRSGNTERPRTRGSLPGLNLLKTRTITATFDIGPPFGSYSSQAGAISALRVATSTEGTTEYPLWIQLPGFPLVACMARVIHKNVPWDIAADIGMIIQNAVVEWEATDPYLYSAPTSASTVGLATPSGGMSFPVTFPLSFGGAATPNQALITNGGAVACWPVLVITGPCLNPTVQNQSVAGGPVLSFNMQLNAGDQLIIDCDLQSIMYYSSGSTVGSSYPQILNPGSTFFAVPGQSSSVIAFNSADPAPVAGTLQIWAASAYSGLL